VAVDLGSTDLPLKTQYEESLQRRPSANVHRPRDRYTAPLHQVIFVAPKRLV